MAISEPDYKAQVGNRIRRAFMAAGWKQEEFAKRTGLGPSAVSKIVNGLQLANSKQMLEIVLALRDAPEFSPYSVGEIQEHLYTGTALELKFGTMMYRHSPSDLHLHARQDSANNTYDPVMAPLHSVG